jgi:hypothetical protein
MVQDRTVSSDATLAQRPIHSRPPIAYLFISASYLRKSAMFAGGTSVCAEDGEAPAAGGPAERAASDAHIDL